MGGDRIPGPFNDIVDENSRRRRELIRRHLEGKENADKYQEAIDRSRAYWIQEFGRLDEIAIEVFNGRRGGFLIKYVDAWLHGDVYNRRLMKPVFCALILKYNLEEDPKGTGASGSPEKC